MQALKFSTYLGASGGELARDVAVDDEGNIYVTGGTTSRDFPTTPGALNLNGGSRCTNCGTGRPMDIFITKFSPSGRVLWSAVLGGPNYDRAYAIGIDGEKNVYIAGRAGEGLPTTADAIQPHFGGDTKSTVERHYGPQDPFVAKISADGARLLWSTYFGGEDSSIVRDMAVTASGDVHLALTNTIVDHPHITTNAFQTKRRGEDAVVAKITSDGKTVVYCTYLGGSGFDGETPSIAVDTQGHAYVLMGTASRDAPVTRGAYDTSYNGGKQDMLISKLSPDGSSLVFSTYLGGSGYEGIETHGITVDTGSQVVVTVLTDSPDLPTSKNAFQRQHRNNTGRWNWDGYVAKFSQDGSTLLAGTYLGGTAREELEGIAVDEKNNIYVSGTTRSIDFPTTESAFQSKFGGGESDGFVARLSSELAELLYGSFIGGSEFDGIRALAIGKNGNLAVVGHTQSPDFPIAQAYATELPGKSAAFVSTLTR